MLTSPDVERPKWNIQPGTKLLTEKAALIQKEQGDEDSLLYGWIWVENTREESKTKETPIEINFEDTQSDETEVCVTSIAFSNVPRELSSEDVLIGTHLRLKTFLQWIESEEKSDKEEYKYGPVAYKNGSVFIYEPPNATHETTKMTFGTLLNQILNRQNVYVSGAVRCSWSANSREPDICCSPRNVASPGPGEQAINPKGDRWSTFVAEVHFMMRYVLTCKIAVSQTWNSLVHTCLTWLTQSHIRVVIAMKIFGRRANGSRAMIAMRYTQANAALPEWIVSFGTARPRGHIRTWIANNITNAGGVANAGPALVGVGIGAVACNAPLIPAYQLHIPIGGANSVFYNWAAPAAPVAPLVPLVGVVGNHVNLDLYDIQQDALLYRA